MSLDEVPAICKIIGINAKVVNGAFEEVLEFNGNNEWPSAYIMLSAGHAVPLIPKDPLRQFFGNDLVNSFETAHLEVLK